MGELLGRPRQPHLRQRNAGRAQNVVGSVELCQIPRDRCINLAQSTPQLLARKALVLGVDGLEFAAVDCDEAGIEPNLR